MHCPHFVIIFFTCTSRSYIPMALVTLSYTICGRGAVKMQLQWHTCDHKVENGVGYREEKEIN